MATQKVVSRPSSFYQDDDEVECIPEETRRLTEVVLYEYIDEKSLDDQELTYDQRSLIHESTSECIRDVRHHSAPSFETDVVVQVAQALKLHGDEFQKILDEDELLQKATTRAFEDTDTGEPSIAVAASHLKSVVERLFEVDENGVARSINLGKIAAIFYYCYSLCKAFVRRTFMGNTLVQLICTLGGYLIATFARVKFYQWLEGRGGWSHLLVSVLPSEFPAWTNNLLLVGGVILIGMWFYNRYIGGQ